MIPLTQAKWMEVHGSDSVSTMVTEMVIGVIGQANLRVRAVIRTEV
jgi:hypothetical protein